MNAIFLEAEWRKLLMLNYIVDPALLEEYLPYHTELDLWQNQCYISLVGFMFLDTRVKGFRIPFHTDFEEVNLRFYVRHYAKNEWKRGVVFVKEIVPRRALSFVANLFYKENYACMKMKHHWQIDEKEIEVSYHWKRERWHQMSVRADASPIQIDEGSEEEFITEHYWGYTRRGPKKTSEYKVEHPLWELYPVKDYAVDVQFETVYGKNFACLNTMAPSSVMLAEGSTISVRKGNVL